MRRQLILTVAATTTMVLLALLVPMGVLMRNFAHEDSLARAALEVQALETVVSGQDAGTVAVYLDGYNRDHSEISTTVLYPDGKVVGPPPGEDDLVRDARETGQARVDEVAGGTQILVPVSLGGGSGLPSQTPVVRMIVSESGLPPAVWRAWAILALLGVAILAGAIALADRLGRSFVRPITALAERAERLGDPGARAAVEGPPEVRTAAVALNRLIERVERLIERERETTADLSHRLRTPITALRLGIDHLASPVERVRLTSDVDRLEQLVDHVVHEAERTGREGLVPQADAVAVVADRTDFWSVLAEDQERPVTVDLAPGPLDVAVSEGELAATVDVLLDNVFTHTPEGTAFVVRLTGGEQSVVLCVEDAGPGLPADLDVRLRGASGGGSTGLGLAIADRTATDAGGELVLDRSPLGGARITVSLGRPA